MTFADQLNQFKNILGCTSKDISNASGLSDSMISRYCSGAREPRPNSDSYNCLMIGLSDLAKARNIPNMNIHQINEAFRKTLPIEEIDYELFAKRFDHLIITMNISLLDLSAHVTYDSSFLSRIRSGKRRPSDVGIFAGKIADYLMESYMGGSEQKNLFDLIQVKDNESLSKEEIRSKIIYWLCPPVSAEDDWETSGMVHQFVTKLDSFDLEEYIRSIHFDKLKIPTVPFQIPHSRDYFGIDGFKQMHIDMAKATVLSRSKKPVRFYSNLPIEEIGKDKEFAQKWMFGLALMLRKELHIHMIHDVYRPLSEMLMGLEGWIPLYMTGLVHPYYLPTEEKNMVRYLTFTSGAVAAEAVAIHGDLKNAHYHLTSNKKEKQTFQERADSIFREALPLMDIFREDLADSFHAFLLKESKQKANWHGMFSIMPLYTMDDALLDRILTRNQVAEEDRLRIKSHKMKQLQLIEDQLSKGTRLDEFSYLSREEFELHPQMLSLSYLFYGKDIPYNYDEYQEHVKQTQVFAQTHCGYQIRENNKLLFRNIQITICEGKWTMLSKNKSPAIHFVIHQPALRSAMEQLALSTI